jgi:hypothetical protein
MVLLTDLPAAFSMNLFLNWISIQNYIHLDTAITNSTQRLILQAVANSDGFDFDVYRNSILEMKGIISYYYDWVSLRNIKIHFLMLKFIHWQLNDLHVDNFFVRFVLPLNTAQIRCLEIDSGFHFQNIISSDEVILIINSCKQLVQLKIDWFSKVDRIDSCILTQLVSVVCRTLNSSEIKHLAFFCRNLEKLVLFSYPHVKSEEITNPKQNCLVASSYTSLIENNSKLEVLSLRSDLYDNEQLCSNQFFKELSKFCPNLTFFSLVLNENHGIALRAVLECIISLKSLEVFTLKMISFKWGEMTLLDYVSQKNDVKYFTIASFDSGTCDDLCWFYNRCDDFGHIELNNVICNEKLIRLIAEGSPELRILQVNTGLDSVSKTVTHYLQEKCPKLSFSFK